MTKEQLDELIKHHTKSIEEAKAKYIDEHKIYNIGQKVIIEQKGKNPVLAIVSKNEIGWRGSIQSTYTKIKKDGTVGQNKINVWKSDIVTLVD